MTSSQQVEVTSGASRVVLRNDDIVIESDNFQITSSERDSPLLMLTNGELVIGADVLEAMGTRGISLEGPVETDILRAHNKQQLNMESPSGSVNIIGSQGVTVESTAGAVSIQSFNELLLRSINGTVSIVFVVCKFGMHACMHAHTRHSYCFTTVFGTI